MTNSLLDPVTQQRLDRLFARAKLVGQLRSFLKALFPQIGEEFINFRALPAGAQQFLHPNNLAGILRFLAAHADEDLFFGVATRRSPKDGSLANCDHLFAIWVDIDFKTLSETEARRRLSEFPLPPSIILMSGGGLHVYWLLSEAVDVQAETPRLYNILRRLARHLGGDLNAAEPARLLRVVGTWNRKYTPPRKVRRELLRPDRRYFLSEFEQILPQEPPGKRHQEGFRVPRTIRDGERNNTLYRLARSLKAKGLGAEAILAALQAENRSRCEPPLPDEEVIRIASHAATQADRPDFRQGPSPGATEPPIGGDEPYRTRGGPTEDGPVLTRLSEVEPEEVEWVWPGRTARGKLHLLIGDPGMGKSRVTLDEASRITRAAPWPDGDNASLGSVLILTAEDGLADTVRPIVDALGGNPSRITVLQAIKEQGVERHFSLERDLPHLEAALLRTSATLLIIDPLSAYLGGVDSYKDAEIRGLLSPLVRLASKHRVAVQGVIHLTKDRNRQALYRALGSVGFVAAARIVFAVGKDPENDQRRLLVQVKNNLTAPAPTLAFTLGERTLTWEAGVVEGIDADDVLGMLDSPERRAERRDAEAFLKELLQGGEIAAAEAIVAAEANGLSPSALFRARKRLGIRAVRRGGVAGRGAWFWLLPTAEPSPKSAKS